MKVSKSVLLLPFAMAVLVASASTAGASKSVNLAFDGPMPPPRVASTVRADGPMPPPRID